MYKTLDELRTKNLLCQQCKLRRGCNQVVPSIGPATSKLLIIGECPGQDEDIVGEPFVGRSGQLLDKLLKNAGINRDDIYITNVVKCHPPKNRTPSPTEIKACKGWLWEELRLVNPKVILTLGRTPSFLLLKVKPSAKMKDIVGKPYTVTYIDAIVYAWYHPSFLLRHSGKYDKTTIDFFKQIKDTYL